MISSLSKRIVFCGNYRFFTPEWRFVDDSSNDNMTWDEFKGAHNINHNYTAKSKRVATNRMKLNRVIDNSEYVVRCCFGRTSNPTIGKTLPHNINGPSTLYGHKTDIVMIRDVSYEVDNTDENFYRSDTNSYVMSDDLSVKLGVKTILGDKLNLTWSESDEDHNEEMYQWIGSHYSTTMIASERDMRDQQEIWLTASEIYTEQNEFTHYASEEHMVKIGPRVKSIKEQIESRYGHNLKLLSNEDYYNCYDKLRKCHISYEKLKKMIGHKKWASYMLVPNKSHDTYNWLQTEEEWATWMEIAIENGYMSAGMEALLIILNDSRFNDYDKYVIGVGGLNEMFHVHESFNWSAWEENFLISEYIRSGELKWLPEYVDGLHNEYQKNISETGMNLCTEETFYQKTHKNKSRIKLYKKEEANGQT